MKFNKKAATICAFVLGVTIFTASGFADIMLGSGYYSLKNSVKATMEKLTSDDVDNFSANMIVSAKIDGKVFSESNNSIKYDLKNKTEESIQENIDNGKVTESYRYSDENQNIYKNFEDDSYEVIQKRKSNKDKIIENPFEEEQVKDAEKILDAFVGSLQDVIQVEESGGKKMYTGNLSETQIPPLANAISSFAFKYGILDEWNANRLDVPSPKSNIHLLNASGKAIENEDGIIESGIFTASISAQDSNGKEHIYSLDFAIDIKDINTTVVVAPNLDGKSVIYSQEGNEFDSKYIGKYKNDIVKIEGSSFEKVGERFVEINSIDGNNLKGRYYEVYNDGYKAENARNFEFYSNPNELIYFTLINYVNENGEKMTGVIHRTGQQNISISFDVEIDEDNGGYSYSSYDDSFDSTFVRIFE